MNKAYKFRMFPTSEQQKIIDKTFSMVVFVYNHFLNLKNQKYQESKTIITWIECSKMLTELKKEKTELTEIDSTALIQTLKNLDQAYKNFYKKNSKLPRLKDDENHKKSYKTQSNSLSWSEGIVILPKVGKVKISNSLKVEGRILSATISKEPSGKYYISICCADVPEVTLPKTGKEIGIDLGIKKFITTSEGIDFDNPRYLNKSLDKLKQLQQILSKKQKGSNNYEKVRIRIAKLSEHIKNQRIDYIQKLSTKLIKENDLICIEDLDIKNMIKNHILARNIMDSSWNEFIRCLEYKAEWYGKEVKKADKLFASSQICHCCGHKNPDVKDLSIRKWKCPQCGEELDRDVNAAINILAHCKSK